MALIIYQKRKKKQNNLFLINRNNVEISSLISLMWKLGGFFDSLEAGEW